MKLVNKTGYLKGAKTAKNPVNIIPSNLITTQGMAFPIKANGKTLYPNTGQYKFPTSHVVETPLKQKGANFIKSLGKAYDVAKPYVKAGIKTAANTLDKIKTKVANQPIIKVRKDLKRIQQQGLKEGLSEHEISKKQLEQVGITSNQRKAYIPVISDLAEKFVTPWGYVGVGGNSKLKQTAKNIIASVKKQNPQKSFVPNTNLGNARNDAWRMYLGKPQKSNTFRMAETAPINHSSYSPKKLKNMDIYSLNKERNLIPNSWDLKPLKNKISVDVDFDVGVMGGYNKRLSSQGLEYNDIWDLEPEIKTTDLLPNKFLSKVDGNKFFDKLLYSKANKDVLTPRSLKIPVKKVLGKPFMSHGNIPDYTWNVHKDKVKNRLLQDFKEGHEFLSQINTTDPDYDTVLKGVMKRSKQIDELNDLPEIKKNGTKTLKYKEGSKGVSLAFSRGEKDPKGGLTQKGVDKYNRATGGNLKMAVTTPPSKLKAGSKAANRRKSFCARMSGVKGPMRKPNGEPSRKALALRKWNC